MKSSSVTIKELSSLSGYSISTVSKALNNKLEISKGTRAAIKAIAKQHNYIPNNYAVSLRIQKSASIAVILPKVTKECYSQALCYLQKAAEDFGYRIFFYQTFNSYEKELNYIKNLSDGSTDGIILISNNSVTTKKFSSYSIPLETINVDVCSSVEEIRKNSLKSLKRLLKKRL